MELFMATNERTSNPAFYSFRFFPTFREPHVENYEASDLLAVASEPQ
jgi:hypothetical protein